MKTKIVMLTGFLGAGKTTLLSALLDEYRESKIGIIVNEFGQISIDGPLLEREGIRMQELANGSIFCACIKENFLKSLIAMSKEQLEILFIEASGLADPSSMALILQAIAPKTENGYTYAGAVCVVDGESFPEYYELLPALHRQVVYSGAIIVNKADLADDETLSEVLGILQNSNPTAKIHVTSYCRVNYRQLVSELHQPVPEAEESTNTFESRPQTFVLYGEKAIDQDELLDFLNVLSESSYRIKGFALTTDGNRSVSCVKHHAEILPWPKEIEKTELVIISAIGIRMVSLLTEELNKRFNGIIHL